MQARTSPASALNNTLQRRKSLRASIPTSERSASSTRQTASIGNQKRRLWASNPNLGVSVYLDTLREAQQRAINIPSLQSAFRSHNLCEWCSADSQWVETTKLAACRERGLKMENFRYWHVGEHPGVVQPNMLRPFVLGMDLASR